MIHISAHIVCSSASTAPKMWRNSPDMYECKAILRFSYHDSKNMASVVVNDELVAFVSV